MHEQIRTIILLFLYLNISRMFICLFDISPQLSNVPIIKIFLGIVDNKSVDLLAMMDALQVNIVSPCRAELVSMFIDKVVVGKSFPPVIVTQAIVVLSLLFST